MPWVDGPLVVNPAAGDILADTGSLPSGDYSVMILVTSEPVGIEVLFEQTDSAGAVIQRSLRLPITLAFMPLTLIPASIRVREGERLRVRNRATLVGGNEVEASIFYAAASISGI